MTLDTAINKFKGYVKDENNFDELDFKEWLGKWAELQNPELISLQGQIIALRTILNYGEQTESIPVGYVEQALKKLEEHHSNLTN